MKNGRKKKAFRPRYGQLLDLRAILGRVPLVALTATASEQVKSTLLKDLNMDPCFKLCFPPHKPNIKYSVHKLSMEGTLADHFEWLLHIIRDEGQHMPKMLVFFHRLSNLVHTYEYLDANLGPAGHVGDPPHSDVTHIFEMYHMKTDDSVKESVLSQFSKEGGHMRVVLASSSFSMGLNIPDITHIVHFGPAMDLDDFLQETAR